MRLTVLRRWFGITILIGGLIVVTNQGARADSILDFVWSPQVAIVWPHDAQGQPSDLAHAQLVNVSVWPTNQVSCAPPPAPGWFDQLLVAKNNDVAEAVAGSSRWTLRPGSGGLFPSMEYNDLSADLATDPTAQYHYVVYGPYPSGPTSAGFLSNVWTHAADARTYLPTPLVPTGFSSGWVGPDARIQIVWPHGANGNYAPPDRAPLVNVAVDLFASGTLLSLPPDPPPYFGLILLAAQENQPLARVEVGPEKTLYTVNGQTFPRWVFDDVQVQPGVRYTFVVEYVEAGAKMASYRSSIWVHAADPRTSLPTPQASPRCMT